MLLIQETVELGPAPRRPQFNAHSQRLDCLTDHLDRQPIRVATLEAGDGRTTQPGCGGKV
ncbi:MAG TPA: hypothetical protein VJY85_13515 [Candidatus Limnocylindria bacterium]|nr:hypothetical protein [Candidatus Limnocylindria bacterium]